MRPALLAIVAIVVPAFAALHVAVPPFQDAEPWILPLVKAKAEYATATSRLLDDLDSALTEKRRGLSGDTLVADADRIESERENLRVKGQWPASIQNVALISRRYSDRDALIKTYVNAQKLANQGDNLKEMHALEDELKAFKLVNDLADWRSLVHSAERGEGEAAWQEAGSALVSPAANRASDKPSSLRVTAVPPDAAQYQIEFVLTQMEGNGLTVQALGPNRELFGCHVSRQQLDTALANKVFGRDGACVRVAAQEGYVKLELEGRPLVRQTLEKATNDKEPESSSQLAWFTIVPDKGARATIDSLRWKPLVSIDTAAAAPSAAKPKPDSPAAKPLAPGADPKGKPVSVSPSGARRPAGGERTAEAVKHALMWLQTHQSPDGHWDCDAFASQCKLGKCDGSGYPPHDIGVTGLALLCFLRSGEMREGGPFEDTVKNCVKYLISQQSADGCYGPRLSNHFLYNHACATLALCEAFGPRPADDLGASVQKGINFILSAENPYSAWRYSVPPDGDNDTSVTGWMVMALKSAKSCGLQVDDSAFHGALEWITEMTDATTGRTGYMEMGTTPARLKESINSFPGERSESLTGIGMLVRIFSQREPERDPMIDKGADLLAVKLPLWDPNTGDIDFYYWYYGTLAMFQVGGPRWDKWNAALKTACIDHQRNNKAECAFGSWDPIDPWSDPGGRVYSTAMNCLCLEVYGSSPRIFGMPPKSKK